DPKEDGLKTQILKSRDSNARKENLSIVCIAIVPLMKRGITDCGLVNLAAQPESFKRSIEELNLSGCYKVTDWGLSKLLPELKRLRVLNLK
ncbi:hypothetical protein QYM36_003832, partial [Artemia franciscana]